MTRSRTIRPIEVTVSFGDVQATATIEPGPQPYGTRDALHRVVDSFADQLNIPNTDVPGLANPWASPTTNGETIRVHDEGDGNRATNDPGFSTKLRDGLRRTTEAMKVDNKMELSEKDRAALVEALATARARRDESTITEDPDIEGPEERPMSNTLDDRLRALQEMIFLGGNIDDLNRRAARRVIVEARNALSALGVVEVDGVVHTGVIPASATDDTTKEG